MSDIRVPEGIRLIHGGSADRGDGKTLCLMEVVAMLAGEHHGFHPECTSPVLCAMGIEANDLLADRERQQLLPLAPELVGTACPHCDQERVESAAMRAGGINLAGMFQQAGRTMEAYILRNQRTPEGMLKAAREALRRYGRSPADDRVMAASTAVQSLEDLDQGDLGSAGARSVMTVYYCTQAAHQSGQDGAAPVMEHIRAVIAACPHRNTGAEG